MGGRGDTRASALAEIHIARNGEGNHGSRAPREREIHIARVATRQRGLVTRRQLLDAGLTSDAIDGRLTARRLHRIHPGVYSLGPVLARFGREQAALLACGPGAVLSHLDAAVVWSLAADDGGPVHVTTTAGGHRQGPAGVVTHRATVDHVIRDGLPVTTPTRTLLDLAAIASPHLERAVNEALVLRLVHADRLLDAAVGRRGAAALRRLLDHGATPTRSEAERRLLALIAKTGLPRPETNVRVHGHEVDALWRAQKLVVEIDGYAFHSSRAAFERDRLRDADLQAAGHRVMRFTWRQLTGRPEAVVARLAAALAASP